MWEVDYVLNHVCKDRWEPWNGDVHVLKYERELTKTYDLYSNATVHQSGVSQESIGGFQLLSTHPLKLNSPSWRLFFGTKKILPLSQRDAIMRDVHYNWNKYSKLRMMNNNSGVLDKKY
jgi:hypothetical protein